MKSMTAYGYGEFQNENYLMTMELKSYNNRFLEIGFFAPPYLSQYEAVVTETIKAHAQRGHIDLSIKVKNIKSNVDVSVDTEAANAYMDAMISLSAIAREKGLDLKPSMGDILSQDGVLTSIRTDGIEVYKEGLDHCMALVMNQFDEAKDREGEITRKDLTSKVDSIANSLETVKKNVDTLEKMIRDNLTARIHEMLGDQKFDESRVLTEVAVMLNRYTINEEVVRLGAHIAEFRKLLQSNEPVGKRMDFLSQEMNREINTIGSKSQIVEVNFEVVNMKDSLENIREQIRNIE
jgi:uncharacterized protein (TIGR00255 family)